MHVRWSYSQTREHRQTAPQSESNIQWKTSFQPNKTANRRRAGVLWFSWTGTLHGRHRAADMSKCRFDTGGWKNSLRLYPKYFFHGTRLNLEHGSARKVQKQWLLQVTATCNTGRPTYLGRWCAVDDLRQFPVVLTQVTHSFVQISRLTFTITATSTWVYFLLLSHFTFYSF